METILITGGAGYIGSHAVKQFLHKKYKVVVFDNLSNGFKDAIDVLSKVGDCEFFEGDLRNIDDIEECFCNYKFDAVLHFGALCSVNESVISPELYFQNNVAGSLNLIQTCIENNVKNFVFSSTCAVYGESQYLPVDEKHGTNPTNPYGESKLMVEKMLKWFSNTYDFNYIALRYFNVCGASDDGLIGDAKKPSVHLVQNAVRGMLDLDEFKLTYSKVDTDDGSPIRDYVDVNDLVHAHYLAYLYLKDNKTSNIFNLGTGKGFSVEEIIQQVEKATGKTLPRNFGETRAGEYAAVYANLDKARDELGWQPVRTLEDSVNSLIKWYKNRPEGFK